MANRQQRLDRVVSYQLSRERLCQHRTAICSRWLRAAQQRLTELYEATRRAREAYPPGKTPAAQWPQNQHRYLRALRRRITGLERLCGKLRQRLQGKQNQVTTAAQYRRATEMALERIRQEVNQILAQNKDKEFHQLVQLKFVDRRLNRNATAPQR